MKLLTADGAYADTHKAGSYYGPHSLPSAGGSIQLADLPGGIVQFASHAAIFRQNPWINAVVSKVSRSLATLPLHTFDMDAKGDRQRVYPAAAGKGSLPRLLRTPTDRMSGVRARRATVIDELVHGNAIWVIRRDPSSALITGFEHVLWRDVVPVLSANKREILGWKVHQTASQWEELAPADVVHFGGGTSPDSPIGLSPLEPLARDLGIYDAVARQLFAFFKNSARPSGNLQLEGANEGVIREVREQIEKMYASPENAGKVLVTTGEYQPMSVTPDQAKVIEVLRITREAACAVYDVPPPVIGDLSNGVKSNVEGMREQYYRDSIGPRAVEHEAVYASQLLPASTSWADLFVEHELRGVLRPTPRDEAEALSLSWEMTLDEKRAVRNLPALNRPGLSDVPMVPAGVMPLGTTGSSDGGASDA